MSIPNKSGRRGTISVLITFFCLAFALPIQATGDTVFTSNTLSNVVDLAEALDATNLVWTTKGSGQPWFPDPEISHDGIASATSGEVQYFDQAPLQTTVIGPGTLNFWWRASGSYPFQALFRVNGVVQRRFESFTDWREETMYLAEGTNVLEWTAATFLIGPWSVVSAVMWLDQVNYTPGPTPPLIQAPPVSQTLPAATNVTFSVLTDGTPPLSYQWQHDGTNILGATETSLTLQDVQATDVGSYRVIVTNSYGVTNVNATLTVTPSPPAIVVQPTNTRAVAGGNCVFKVVAQGSKPFSYQWQFNDSPIAGATASELVVTSVNTEYIGNYSVVVSNTSGTIVSTNATMILVPSLLIGWGFNSFGQATVPMSLSNVTAFAGGADYSLAVDRDGKFRRWGNPWLPMFCPDFTDAIAFAPGFFGIDDLALRHDGTVLGLSFDIPPGLTNIVAVAVSGDSSLALRNDGTVVTWSRNHNDQAVVLPELTNVVAIASGDLNNLALRADGTVVAWGNNDFGQTNIPPGLSNVVAIAAGPGHSLALKADGTVVAWGYNSDGQINVPQDLTDVIAIAAGYRHNLALRKDGTVAAWGTNTFGQLDIPAMATNVVALACGGHHCLALLTDGSPFVTRQPWCQTASQGKTVVFNAVISGAAPLTYQWQHDGTNIIGATNASLTLTNVGFANVGKYQCVASNSFGTATSLPATLTIFRPKPQFATSPQDLNLSSQGINLQLNGLAGHGTVIIYTSTNLLDWQPIFTNPPTTGSLRYQDPSATNLLYQFYQAIEQ